MDESLKKNSFDRLVAGLSSEERNAMLSRLNSKNSEGVEIYADTKKIDKFSGDLKLRLANESFFYRLVIWLRSFFSKTPAEKIYNDDVLLNLAKKINREHPGVINPQAQVLDSLFYERLSTLKQAADFFKPYLYKIQEDEGEFYVFLSSFVVSSLCDQINSRADPYNLPPNKEPDNETRTELLRNLDDVLKNMSAAVRGTMYSAVKSVQWLSKFVNLPFIHFISQFTDIRDGVFTCPYMNARVDFASFASVFDSGISVPNEVMESVFLFSQKKNLTGNYMTSDIEDSVKKFMATATNHLTQIKMFLSVIPITTTGRIIFQDYNWLPETSGGGEDWFVKFRNQWRKVIETRWNDYLREQKKKLLSDALLQDFGLNDFPEFPVRPWAELWGGIPFGLELTGGYLAWYCRELYPADHDILNTLMMEGIFIKSENRTEFSDAFNQLSKAADTITNLVTRIDFKGDIGTVFEEAASSASRTFQAQNRIESLVKDIETEIKASALTFCNSIRILETIFKGIFDEVKDGFHGTLQNMNSLKGHGNLNFKDSLKNTRKNLRQTLYYLSELEPIDLPAGK